MTEDHLWCAESECGCKVVVDRGTGLPIKHERRPECHPGVAPDLDALQARWDKVSALRATKGPNGKPLTLQQIGDSFDPPITRQRVDQMLRGPRPESPGGARRPT